MGGMERESKILKVNNGGERDGVATSPMKKKGAFYSPFTKYDRCRFVRPENLGPGKEYLPLYLGLCPKVLSRTSRGPDSGQFWANNTAWKR
jgi:hypothetical protein